MREGMNPLAQSRNDERVIYDCSRGLPPPYPTSKPILNDSTCAANRTFVYPAPPHSQHNTSSRPVESALQTFNQMIGTVQPLAHAQAFKSQQVLSNVNANLQAQNNLVCETVSQPMYQTVAVPGRRQATILSKDNTVKSKEVQQLALNGLVWMTTNGQTVQTANNVQNIHSARMMQAFNPVIAYQNQNVGHSSKTLISITSANGSVPHISMGQGCVNVSESQGNRSSSLVSVIANNFVKCDDQIQIQAAYGKVGVDQVQYKAPSTVPSNTPAQLCQKNWTPLTNSVSRPALAYGTQTRVDSSQGDLQGSSVWLSTQQNVQHNTTNSWFSPTNSNGQKGMVLARVTPMSHDWRNLQQNPHAFLSTDTSKLKNLHEDTHLHHKLGSSQQNRSLEDASSTSEKSVEKTNHTTTQSPTAGINTERNIPRAPVVAPLTFKPNLYRQQNVHNIHFYTPSTINGHSIITSPISSSDLNAQHNVTAPGNNISTPGINISTAKLSSQNTVSVASHLSPLSVGHCNFGVSPISNSNSITQQIVTASAVGVGALYNSGDHQGTLPPSDVPQSMNVVYSTIRLASKNVGKQTIQFVPSGSNPPPVGFSNENPVLTPIHLSSRGDYGKQSAAGLVLVIPSSVVVHNCQNMEGTSVYSPSTILTHGNMPVRLTEDQGEISKVVEVPTSVLEKSQNTPSLVANPSSLTERQREEICGIGSSPVGGFCEQQTNYANPPPVPNPKSPTGLLSSSSESNGKKRNLILGTGTSFKDSSTKHDLMSCDGQENSTVIDDPPQKRFLASALEDASKDANGGKNVLPCVDKAINSAEPYVSEKAINSPKLITCSERQAKDEATITVARDGTVEPEIYITGVFSLGGRTGLWGSDKTSSPCSFVDLTGPPGEHTGPPGEHTGPPGEHTGLSAEEVNNSSASKGSITRESSLKEKVSHVQDCDMLVVEENTQTTCAPLSNFKSRPCSSVTESPKMVHEQSILESSLEKNIDQLSSESDEGPADILIDLTGDEDNLTEPLQTDSVLPSDKEPEEKLVSDKSIMSFEINGPSPLKSLEKKTQDLDGLLHSIDTAIEALLNFWTPSAFTSACDNNGKSACNHYNLQDGETCECNMEKIAKETALSSFEEVHMPNEGDKAGLHEDADCNSPCNIKVLGHTEILNLLDEISKSIPNERLPAEGAGSETFSRSVMRLSEEMQSKASQNTSSDGCKDSSSKAMEMKSSGRHGGEQNHAPLRSLSNKSSTVKKGKQQEKKVYCCINAWLVASGVLGIYCHCKLSQGNKTENQTDLPNAVHETQNSNETSNPNCIVNHLEIETILDNVPIATHGKHDLEVSENWNSMPRSCSSIVPDCNQEKVMGEVQQEVGVEAMHQSSESSTRVVEETEREGLCKPGNANLNHLNTSEESDKLTCKVTLDRKLDQKKIKENKNNSQDVVEIEPDKEIWTILLEKELNEDKTKDVSRDPSPNVLTEEASSQTDAKKLNQHLGVKLEFKGKKRKSGKNHHLEKSNHSPQKKTRLDIEDAKLLPSYNCHVMIRDKTYSSSGERAVLVSLLPIAGQPSKAREKARAIPQ
uniref:uncharacterized protein isoform X2 n=1 Tax=Pristiophorus japonicus TaxID=55135 RepID=UPI00398F3369